MSRILSGSAVTSSRPPPSSTSSNNSKVHNKNGKFIGGSQALRRRAATQLRRGTPISKSISRSKDVEFLTLSMHPSQRFFTALFKSLPHKFLDSHDTAKGRKIVMEEICNRAGVPLPSSGKLLSSSSVPTASDDGKGPNPEAEDDRRSRGGEYSDIKPHLDRLASLVLEESRFVMAEALYERWNRDLPPTTGLELTLSSQTVISNHTVLFLRKSKGRFTPREKHDMRGGTVFEIVPANGTGDVGRSRGKESTQSRLTLDVVTLGSFVHYTERENNPWNNHGSISLDGDDDGHGGGDEGSGASVSERTMALMIYRNRDINFWTEEATYRVYPLASLLSQARQFEACTQTPLLLPSSSSGALSPVPLAPALMGQKSATHIKFEPLNPTNHENGDDEIREEGDRDEDSNHGQDDSEEEKEVTFDPSLNLDERLSCSPYNETLEEHGIPLEGHDTPLEGHDTPLEGHDTPSEGHDTPSEEHDTPSEEHDIPSEEHDTPSEEQNGDDVSHEKQVDVNLVKAESVSLEEQIDVDLEKAESQPDEDCKPQAKEEQLDSPPREQDFIGFEEDFVAFEEDSSVEKEPQNTFEEWEAKLEEARSRFRIPSLNSSQKMAAHIFLSSRPGSISLVQGPPGTGKTQLLTATICRYFFDNPQELFAGRRRLMVCAPTNRAVTVLASRYLQVAHGNTALNVVMAGDKEKLLTDDRNGLRSLLVYTWVDAMADQWIEIRRSLKNRDPDALLSNAKALIERLSSQIPEQFVLEELSGVTDAIVASLIELFSCSASEEKSAPVKAKLRDLIQKLVTKLRRMKEEHVTAELLSRAHLIFCTLTAAGSALVKKTKPIRDLIVDEAAAATEPELYIPFHLRPQRLMVVGDPKQLPASVRSRFAEKLGLNKSLQERLMYDCQRPYTLLDVQYRMKSEICQFPSQNFYQGKVLSSPRVFHEEFKSQQALPLNGRPYVFLHVNGEEKRMPSGSTENFKEARKVIDVLCELRNLARQNNHNDGSSSSDWNAVNRVRVISFYQAQVDLIRRLLRGRGDLEQVVVSTVDSSQGCEADVVIVSFVRTGQRKSGGGGGSGDNRGSPCVGFLQDDRRLNVSITRARFQLICIGHVDGLATASTGESSSSSPSSIQALVADAQQRDVVIKSHTVGNGDVAGKSGGSANASRRGATNFHGPSRSIWNVGARGGSGGRDSAQPRRGLAHGPPNLMAPVPPQHRHHQHRNDQANRGHRQNSWNRHRRHVGNNIHKNSSGQQKRPGPQHATNCRERPHHPLKRRKCDDANEKKDLC